MGSLQDSLEDPVGNKLLRIPTQDKQVGGTHKSTYYIKILD